MLKQFMRGATAAVFALLASCSDAPVQPAPPRIATISIVARPGAVYEADIVELKAAYRDSLGVLIPDAPVEWSLSDSSRALISPNGYLSAYKAGAVRVIATSGATKAHLDVMVVRPAVENVVVYIPVPNLAVGDVSSIGVQSRGPGGRSIFGRHVTLTSDTPELAIVDVSGQVRGVAPGVATIRATVEGVTDTQTVEILAEKEVHTLSRRDGASVPVLIAGDSITWSGRREFHEVYLEKGTLKIWRGSSVRYESELRYAQYNVITVNGERRRELRIVTAETDYGSIRYDARGDMIFTSGIIVPLSHVGSMTGGGIEMKYRVPGTDEYHWLFYRQEPR